MAVICWRLRPALLAALWLASGIAAASGLQVSPVSLTIPPLQNADGLWLSNTGDSALHAQVRVYRWTQEDGADKLTASRGLVVSPPMLQLAASDRQLVRAIRLGPPPSGAEEAYRLIIDELPVDAQGRKGLNFVLRYSVPIFVEPPGPAQEPPSAAQLQWTLRRDADKTVLEVANTGSKHAQLADLQYVDTAGRRTVVHAGLLGYVLPGAQMRWMVKAPATALGTGGTWEAMINGATATQNIQWADRPR